MVNEVIGAVLQIFVFATIPFLVYVIRYRKVKGFLEYVGLKPSTKRANYLAVFASLLFAVPVLILILISDDIKTIMFDPESVTGKIREMGFGISSVFILLMIALLKTSFAEELLFRGFLAKRLIAVLGYSKGNLIQAVLFGIIHTILFAMITSNAVFLMLIFMIPSLGAYVSVYLNEKVAAGSIIPGWISHGLANVLAYVIVGFVI